VLPRLSECREVFPHAEFEEADGDWEWSSYEQF